MAGTLLCKILFAFNYICTYLIFIKNKRDVLLDLYWIYALFCWKNKKKKCSQLQLKTFYCSDFHNQKVLIFIVISQLKSNFNAWGTLVTVS